MPISLHTASVGSFLQILPSVAGLIAKAEEHCKATGQPAEALTDCRLADDMWPFAKQVMCTVQHSAGAISGVRAGVVSPDISSAPLDFASLHKAVADGIALLEAVEPAEIEAMVGRDMRFEFGPRRMDFTVEDFLLTFSLPNFYFHAATAYGVLRSKGLAIGKMDFMGRLRMKG